MEKLGCRKQRLVGAMGEGESRMNGDSSLVLIYMLTCETDSLALCDYLEGGMGGEEGGSAGGDMCIIMADSHRCMAETNTA